MALITSPLDITGCQLWLDANQGLLDQFGNPVTADGTSIGTWRDQSGNNNHVSSSSGTRPTYKTNVRTSYERYSNTVRFGGNGLLAAGDVLELGTNHALLFAVIKNNTAPTFNAQHIMSKSRSGLTGQYFLCRTSTADTTVSNGLLGFAWTNGFMNTTLLNTCSEYTIVCWNLLRNQSNNGPMRMRANKYQVSTDVGGGDNGGNFPLSARFCIGGRNDSTGFADNTDPQYYFNGDICECGVYRRSTPYNTYEIQQLENYLYNKWFSSTIPTIFGCKVWLDASDSTTLFKDRFSTIPAVITDNNNPIGCWKNKATVSGGYGDFTALPSPAQTVTHMPSARVSSYNGLSTVWFDGLASAAKTIYLSLSAPEQTVTGGFRHQQQTAFVVTAPHPTNFVAGARILTSNRYLASGNNDGSFGFIPFAQSALNTVGSYIDGGALRSGVTVKNGAFNILTSRGNNTVELANTLNSQLTGYYQNTTFTGRLSSYGFRLGAYIRGGGITGFSDGVQYNGEISEVIIYDRFLTNSECHQVEYYLAKKWNIPDAKFTYAVKNGNWSDDTTWSTNDVPGLSSDVYSNGYNVTIDQPILRGNVLSLRGTPPPPYPSLSLADNGSFILNDPLTLNVTPSSNSHFNIVAGSAPCLNLNVNTGVVSITGNIISGNVSTAYGVIQNGTSSVIVDGNVIARQAQGFRNISGQDITITKTISGGISDDAYGLYNEAPFCNITVLSGIISGTGTRCAGISSVTTGNLEISGRLLAGPGLSACVINSPYTSNISITGEIFAGNNTNNSGIVCLTATDINIFGNIVAGTGLSAIGIHIQQANNVNIVGNVLAGTGAFAKGVLIPYSSNLTMFGSISGRSGALATGVELFQTNTVTVSGASIHGGAGLSACGMVIPYANNVILTVGDIRGNTGRDSCGVFCLSSSENVTIDAKTIGGNPITGTAGVGAIGVSGPITTGTVSVTGYIGGGGNTDSAGLVLYNYGPTYITGFAVGGWGNNVINNHGITNFNSPTLTIVGVVSGGWATGTSPIPNSCGIRNFAATHLEITGKVSGGDGSPSTGVLDTSAIHISITGDVYGGRGTDSTGLNTTSAVLTSLWVSGNDILGRTGYAIDLNNQNNPASDTTRTIIGNNIRGSILPAIRGSRVGKTTIIGNLLGSTSTGNTVINTMGSIDIIGNVTGNPSAPTNAAAVINNEFTGTVSITGNLFASANQGALYSPYLNGLNYINGSVVNASNGRQAVWARSYFVTPNMFNGYITHATDTESTITFYAPQSYPVTHLPPMSSVQAGVEYAAIAELSSKPFVTTNQLTGNMILPSVSSVSFGEPVGMEVGQVKLRIEDLIETLGVSLNDPMLSQPNTFAQKMKETCTKQTIVEAVKHLTGVSNS